MSLGLKICGITRAEDLRLCGELGVDAVGINLWRGSRRGLPLDEARAMVRAAPCPALTRVGVLVDAPPREIERARRELALDLVQLHGDVHPDAAGDCGPYVWVIRGTPDLARLRIPRRLPAWVLLDAWVPGFGGAGARTDWGWARAAVRTLSPMPVWLAGGITPANVLEAARAVDPAGLDVASGAEVRDAVRGEKDRARIEALVRACKS